MELESVGDLVLYKMMADESKLRILKLLTMGEKSVSEIVAAVGLPQPLTSHKLKDLRENGLVSSFRSGKRIIYRVSNDSLTRLMRMGEEVGREVPRSCDCVECQEQG